MKLSGRTILFIITLFLLAAPARAQRDGYGLGIILGEPTGFSFKGWIDGKSAIDAGLAWSFLHETSLHIHVDYLLHTTNVTKRKDIPAYYGIGGRIKTEGHGGDRIGVRIVGGLVYYLPESPIDIFGEIAPILDFAPETDFQINVGIGMRYYFE
jgi:hypothetical protein